MQIKRLFIAMNGRINEIKRRITKIKRRINKIIIR